MSKAEFELLSKNAYAKYLGVNEKAIRKAITEGRIKRGWDDVNQKVIKHLADKEYGFQHLTPKTGPGVSKGKVLEKLQSEKKPAKVTKPRTEFGSASDEIKQIPKSDTPLQITTGLTQAQISDLSKLGAAELLQYLPITADMTYQEAMTTNLIIEAALKKKKLEEVEDILVRKQSVENALYAFGSALRKDLLAIPSRVTDDMMTSANKIEAMNVLTEELTNILEKYSTENIKLTNKE
jgi:hypothetical protein